MAATGRLMQHPHALSPLSCPVAVLLVCEDQGMIRG